MLPSFRFGCSFSWYANYINMQIPFRQYGLEIIHILFTMAQIFKNLLTNFFLLI